MAVSLAESSGGSVEGRGRCGEPSPSYWQKLLQVPLGVPGPMVIPACGTAHGMRSPGGQKTRHCCYPISWLGLWDPKSLASGCLAFSGCKCRTPAGRPDPILMAKALPLLLQPRGAFLTPADAHHWGPQGPGLGPSLSQHGHLLVRANDCVFLHAKCRTDHIAVCAPLTGSCLTFYLKKKKNGFLEQVSTLQDSPLPDVCFQSLWLPRETAAGTAEEPC